MTVTTFPGVSVVIPAYNEEHGIAMGLEAVTQALEGWMFEIIVVDDGSTDNTAGVAEKHAVDVLRLNTNGGYGAALKAGIAHARFPWVAIIDADATYPAADLPRLLALTGSHDMIVGARTGSKVAEPLSRTPAKWVLRKFAELLAGAKIPDLNSGMRVILKDRVHEFTAILPSGFSFTTTITLSMICRGYPIAYVPIDYFKRVGRSKIKPFHAVKFAFLITRTIWRFRPMRVLAPLVAAAVLAGLIAFALQ